LPGGFALLAGLNAALSLLGLPAPVDSAGLDQVHGVLLVLGFVGTMVALERAVAAGRWWCYCSPAALGAGGVLLAGPAPRTLSGVLLLVGCSGLIAVYVPLWRRSTDVAVLVQAGGAVLATGAAVLWLGHVPVPDLFPFLAGFLVLTITGERLELARVAMVGASAETLLAVVSAVTVTGAVVALMWPSVGYAVLGAALLATTMWLARYDVARRTVRAVGLPRFMAVCLLAGYAWLAVPGAVWLLHGPVFGGRGYDAVVHAVMLGFVLSMIMAHAPVILPAVIRRPLPYTPVMYVPVALLHLSLLLRIAIGDGRDIEWAVRAGGLGNIVAVLAFVAVAVASAVRARGGSATPAAVRPGVVA
jgi:hypothetical protein